MDGISTYQTLIQLVCLVQLGWKLPRKIGLGIRMKSLVEIMGALVSVFHSSNMFRLKIEYNAVSADSINEREHTHIYTNK